MPAAEEQRRGFVLKDTYFRRVFVPLVLAILIFASIAVIVTSSPDGASDWSTYSTVFGGKQLGGALKRLARRN
jgi:hypothetical protein